MDTSRIIRGRDPGKKQEEALRQRRQMTHAETVLWEHLRANRLDGFHFRRQQVIDGLIVDFYCHAAGLVIECDGPIHERQTEHDEDRDAILKQRGLHILRFTNEEIENNTERVLADIRQVASERRNALNQLTDI